MFHVHGQLFVQILRAKRLHCERIGRKKSNKPDPYVRIAIGESLLAETKVSAHQVFEPTILVWLIVKLNIFEGLVIVSCPLKWFHFFPQIVRGTRDPRWDEFYLLDVCHQGDTLDLLVLDESNETQDLGMLNIPLQVTELLLSC